MINENYINKYLEIDSCGYLTFAFNVVDYNIKENEYYADGIICRNADVMEVYCGKEFTINDSDIVTTFNTKKELFARVLDRFDEMLDDQIGLNVFK